jgi:hypothetical protein
VLTKLGGWIMEEGFPLLVENLVIMGAMISAQKLLDAWGCAADQALANTAPEQGTGLGLLLNYMLNPNNSVQQRWQTFADLVQQARPDAAEQGVLLDAIVTTADPTADQAAAAWRWPEDTRDALVAVLATYTGDLAPEGYRILGAYAYNGTPLPIKVAAEVALDAMALAAQPTPGVSYATLQVFYGDQGRWVQQTPDGLSVANPGGLALARFDNKLFLAYTGQGRLLCLLSPSANSGSSASLDQQLVLPYTSLLAPSLVAIGDCLLLLFVGDGNQVYGLSSSDGSTFGQPRALRSAQTNAPVTSLGPVGAADIGNGRLGLCVLDTPEHLSIYAVEAGDCANGTLDLAATAPWNETGLAGGFGAPGPALAGADGLFYLGYTAIGAAGGSRTLRLLAGAYPQTRPAPLTLADPPAVDSGLGLTLAEDGKATPNAVYLRNGQITLAAPAPGTTVTPGSSAAIPLQEQTFIGGAQPALCFSGGRAYLAFTVPTPAAGG